MTTAAPPIGINFLRLGAQLARKPSLSRGGLSPLSKSGCLVILDIHGVLIERIAAREKYRLRHAMDRRRHWRRLRGHNIWMRPYLETFLSTLSARHDVAVWSSAQPRTIDEFLTSISAEFRITPPYQDTLSFIWDRTKCRQDVKNGKYATMKYLQDLWQDTQLGSKYSSRNTLLLDDSPTKNRFFPNSGITVPEYRADLLKERYNKDDTLLWLLLYIEYLISVSRAVSGGEGLLDLSQTRCQCLALQDFIYEGELTARRLANSKQRKGLKSLALVFLNDLEQAANAPCALSHPPKGNEDEHAPLPHPRPTPLLRKF